MSAHAPLSPSSSARWINCPGSVAAIAAAGIGDTSNAYAREGTAAHTLAERALSYDKTAAFWLGEAIKVAYEENGVTKYDVYIVDDDMAANVQMYVDEVRREPGSMRFFEQRLDLSDFYGVPEQFGTADAVVLDFDAKQLAVFDLKYGRGVQVFARDNSQLLSYAGGALREYGLFGDFETVKVVVHQPRLNHVDAYTYTVDEVRAFGQKARNAARVAIATMGTSADAIEAMKTAGEAQCQWCPIRGDCAVLAAYVHKTVFESFEDVSDMTNPNLSVKEIVTLTPEQRSAILGRRDLIASFMSDVESSSLNLAQNGTKVPGWKVVEGRKGPRQWSDEREAEELLKKAARLNADQMYTKKVISPTQAEKVLKPKPKVWEKLLAFITQAEGKPALVPESDKRPEVASSSAFNNTDLSGLF